MGISRVEGCRAGRLGKAGPQRVSLSRPQGKTKEGEVMTGGVDGAGVEENPEKKREKLLVEPRWWERLWRGTSLRRNEDKHSKLMKKMRPGQGVGWAVQCTRQKEIHTGY